MLRCNKHGIRQPQSRVPWADDELLTSKIRSRSIYFIGGYDPKSPAEFFARMAKEKARFETLWGEQVELSPVEVSASGEIGSAVLTNVSGSGAAVACRFNSLVLDSLVLADFAQPLPVRLGKYLAALADFVVTGTAFRIFAKAWRLGLYFLFPIAMILLFALLGYLAAKLTAPWLGWMAVLPGVAVFAGAQAILGQRWPVNHLMDLWSFSLNFIRGRRPDAEALMERFAQAVVDQVRAEKPDELILVGHSTGGLLIIDIAARALRLDPDVFRAPGRAAILTLGSTALKAGLHPAGQRFRDDIRLLSEHGQIDWAEVQCLTDIINFYKSDPVADIGLQSRPTFPLVARVRVKDMLEEQTYKRIKRNFFRVHYQYIFGNTKRYWYDFFQICCGPTPLIERVKGHVVGALPPERPMQ